MTHWLNPAGHLDHRRAYSLMFVSFELIPNDARLGRILRSCEVEGRCPMAFECLHRGSLLRSFISFKCDFTMLCFKFFNVLFHKAFNFTVGRPAILSFHVLFILFSLDFSVFLFHLFQMLD